MKWLSQNSYKSYPSYWSCHISFLHQVIEDTYGRGWLNARLYKINNEELAKALVRLIRNDSQVCVILKPFVYNSSRVYG